MSTALIPFDDLQGMASAIAKSGLFGMKTPDQALALMLVAQAEGQHPATITQDYDIIQGRAARKTHSVLARFQQMGGSVEWHELTDNIADATFSHKSGGRLRMTWTLDQAHRAKLTGKDNWKNYPRAMLRARCIAEGIRAVYPAALGGMLVGEEAQDMPAASVEKDMGTAEVVSTQRQAEKPSLPAYAADQFAENLATWRGLIDSGKASADQIITRVSSKYRLSDAQKDEIRKAEQPQQPESSEPEQGEDNIVDADWTSDYETTAGAEQ